MKYARAIIIASLIIMLCMNQSQASDLDTSKYFTYPDTEIVVSSGSTVSISSVKDNYQYPKNPYEMPHFVSVGYQMKGFPHVKYQFMGKCEHGDVYVFTITEEKRIPKVIPFVFDGKRTIIDKRGGLEVIIQVPKK